MTLFSNFGIFLCICEQSETLLRSLDIRVTREITGVFLGRYFWEQMLTYLDAPFQIEILNKSPFYFCQNQCSLKMMLVTSHFLLYSSWGCVFKTVESSMAPLRKAKPSPHLEKSQKQWWLKPVMPFTDSSIQTSLLLSTILYDPLNERLMSICHIKFFSSELLTYMRRPIRALTAISIYWFS